jgi:lysozyme
MILIVDFSHWQGNVDPYKLIAAGVSAAIVKAGQYWKNQETTDSKYFVNMDKLEEAQLPHGSYYYFQPAESLSNQARHYKRLWSAYPKYPIILDVEDTQKVQPKEMARRVKIMLDSMEEFSGMKPVIYTRNGFWVNQVGNPDWSDDYMFWLAQYPKLTNKSMQNVIMHQFTDRLSIPGCPAMDGNYWLGTEAEFYELLSDKEIIPYAIEQIEENRIKKSIFALSRKNRQWLENITR